MPRLINIATKTAKRKPMQMLTAASVTKQCGIASDFRGKPGKRQVTVLSFKAWSAACEALNYRLDWLTRRANLLVDDLDFYQTSGQIIAIGSVRLLITGETDPCSRMDEAQPGLCEALLPDWRGGVCCQVIEEGEILINDKVTLI